MGGAKTCLQSLVSRAASEFRCSHASLLFLITISAGFAPWEVIVYFVHTLPRLRHTFGPSVPFYFRIRMHDYRPAQLQRCDGCLGLLGVGGNGSGISRVMLLVGMSGESFVTLSPSSQIRISQWRDEATHWQGLEGIT